MGISEEVMKPIVMRNLAETIRKVLDERLMTGASAGSAA